MAIEPHAAPGVLIGSAHARLRAAEDPLAQHAAVLLGAGAPQRVNCYWKHFCAFCEREARTALPAMPADVMAFMLHQQDAGTTVGAIRSGLSAIRRAHRASEQRDPTRHSGVQRLMRGMLNTRTTRDGAYVPCRWAMVRRLMDAAPWDDIRACRDRAMILLLYFAPLRPFELVRLTWDDVEVSDRGILLRIGGLSPRTVGIGDRRERALCPVYHLRKWIAASQCTTGYVLRGIRTDTWEPHRVDAKFHLGGTPSLPMLTDIVQNAYERAAVREPGMMVKSIYYGFLLDALDAGLLLSEIAERTGYATVRCLRRELVRLGVPYADLSTPAYRDARRVREKHLDRLWV